MKIDFGKAIVFGHCVACIKTSEIVLSAIEIVAGQTVFTAEFDTDEVRDKAMDTLIDGLNKEEDVDLTHCKKIFVTEPVVVETVTRELK